MENVIKSYFLFIPGLSTSILQEEKACCKHCGHVVKKLWFRDHMRKRHTGITFSSSAESLKQHWTEPTGEGVKGRINISTQYGPVSFLRS